MSERKVINKYFPPDYDPSKIKRRKHAPGTHTQQTIRLMAPFSMRCSACGEYIYKGKKFNARKETAKGEEYYGIKIFRFYIKCTLCSAEITFKTDPKNADYICEHGAKRNFENWIETDPSGKIGAIPDAAADDVDPDAPDPDKDAMALLETSQEQSKREMDEMDELADLRSRNARMERKHADPSTLDPTTLLSALHAERASAEEEARLAREQEEDDALVSQHFARVAAGPSSSAVGDDDAPAGGVVKRATVAPPTIEALLAAKDAEKEKEKEKPKVVAVKKRKDMAAALGIKVVKKPKKV